MEFREDFQEGSTLKRPLTTWCPTLMPFSNSPISRLMRPLPRQACQAPPCILHTNIMREVELNRSPTQRPLKRLRTHIRSTSTTVTKECGTTSRILRWTDTTIGSRSLQQSRTWSSRATITRSTPISKATVTKSRTWSFLVITIGLTTWSSQANSS